MFKLMTINETNRHFDPWAAGILIFSLMVAGYQLVVTRWIDSLYIVLTIALFGGILGLFLGYSRFSRFSAFLLGFIYGTIIIAWQLSLTLERETPWLDRLESVAGSLNLAVIQLISTEPVETHLFFLSLMAVLFWLLSVFAGYCLIRNRNPWLSIIPTGILALIVYIYGSVTDLSAGYFAFYLFLALILTARVFINEKQIYWNRSLTQVPDLLNFDLMRITLVITVILVLTAWLLPVGIAALPSFQEAWGKATRSWEAVNVYFEKAFAAIKPSAQKVSGYYDDSHPLGRGNTNSDDTFLIVNAPTRPSNGVRYYWRARSFDTYTEGSWENANAEIGFFKPENDSLPLLQTTGRWNADIMVETQSLISTLYFPVETTWVNRPVRTVFTENPDGSYDLAAVHAEPQLREGSTYEIHSSLANYSVEELRQAGTEYPTWVEERYLQLPESITQRTIELAEFIIKGQDNVHDKTAAITLWLRDNIEYSYTVPRIPENRDTLDWFLFDVRRGFCNYYASAEVILLRSVGIPARFNVGYDQGERVTEPVAGLEIPSDDRELYRVLKKNAHSWPEVFFPGYGWVEFEPTVSQDPLVRPLNRDVALISPSEYPDSDYINDPEFMEEFDKRAFFLEREFERLRTEPMDDELPRPGWVRIPWQFFIIVLMVILFFMVRQARKRREIQPVPVLIEAGIERLGWKPPAIIRRWARESSLKPMERAFHEVNLALRRIGSPALPTETPLERGLRLVRYLPETAVPVQMLLKEYQASVYSEEPGSWVLVMPNMRLIRKQSYLGLMRRIIPGLTRK